MSDMLSRFTDQKLAATPSRPSRRGVPTTGPKPPSRKRMRIALLHLQDLDPSSRAKAAGISYKYLTRLFYGDRNFIVLVESLRREFVASVIAAINSALQSDSPASAFAVVEGNHRWAAELRPLLVGEIMTPGERDDDIRLLYRLALASMLTGHPAAKVDAVRLAAVLVKQAREKIAAALGDREREEVTGALSVLAGLHAGLEALVPVLKSEGRAYEERAAKALAPLLALFTKGSRR